MNKIKKITAMFAVFCMTLSVTYGTVFAAGGVLSGEGTEGSPYLIEDAADLKVFRDRVNAGESTICAKLTADIDLGNEEWSPIKPTTGYVSDAYSGIFDGDYYKIKGLYVNATVTNVGLFGLINGATIKNLAVEGNISSSKAYVGGIVGKVQQGKIENCYFSGTVSTSIMGSSGHAGGIVGYAGNSNTQKGYVKNSFNKAAVTGGVCGGIAGYAKYSEVENCYNTGEIQGTSRSGGIGGQFQNNCAVASSYNIGVISGSATHADIVDFLYSSSSVTNCYGLSKISGAGTGTVTGGGIISETTDLLSALGSAFVADLNEINDGYPILSWQAETTPQPKNPHIEINGAGKLYLTNSSEKPTTTLNVQYIDIDDEKAVEWSTESSIITLSQPDEPDELGSSITVTAQSAGTAAVTAVTADGYSAEYEIEVFPYVTTCEITGDVRVGNTVSAKINVLGGSEYDYANYPAINVKWKYLTRGNQGTSNYTVITGTNGYTMSIGNELEGCYLTYEIWIGNEQKMPSRPIRVAADVLRVTLGCGSTFDYDTNYTAEIDSPNKFIAVITGYKRGKAVYIKILNQNALYNTISFNIPAESSAERVRLLVWSKDGFKPLTSDVYEAAVS